MEPMCSRFFTLLLLLFCLTLPLRAENFSPEEPVRYTVHFIGVNNTELLKTLKSASDLTSFRKNPPASLNALRYRADSDIPGLLKVLHAEGYYEASIDIRIEEFERGVQVFVLIQPGVQYTLTEFTITLLPSIPFSPEPEQLGVRIGKPVNATAILEGEQNLLNLLANQGYPLATVENKEMVADGNTKTLRVHLTVNVGALSTFGPSEIQGLHRVKPALIEKKIAWKTAEIYESDLVEKTQEALLDTGLFSSVLIARTPVEEGTTSLPMRLDLTENKHRSINAGVSYQTFFGPGITFGWENRNIGGVGRKLSLQGDITKKTHTGVATFLVPDFYRIDQDLVTQAQALYEDIYAYSDRSYTLMGRVERRIGLKYRLSMGVRLERMIVGESVSNGTFTLFEVPLYFRFSSAKSLLDPVNGSTLEYKLIPSTNFSHPNHFFLQQSLSYMLYSPLNKSRSILIAQQLNVQSIISKNLSAVPVPKRVLGGSEQDLRGYRYLAVSPLRGDRPIGGQSGIFYTLETRFRLSKTIGLVPFFDLGNVYLTEIPKWDTKWFKSVGLGFRYFSFLGPLRFDIAFPLDRRPGIDPRYRILASIGQTF